MNAYPSVTLLRTNDDAPRGLWPVPAPAPQSLRFRGSSEALKLLERLPDWGLGVVGTREPQARSTNKVRETILELRDTNLVILSGLARGIDAAAHEAALEAELPTIAILGSGLNQLYPRENVRLAEQILEQGGLLASEFPDDMPPQPGLFIRRNRLIAGWSRALWVVEAGFRSGSLNTARFTRDLHRDLYATPCFPGDPALVGNQRLIDFEHARPVWGAHAFGATWLTLAARIPRQAAKATPAENGRGDAIELLDQLRASTAKEGGATAEQLLQWALARGWPPQKFFLALQEVIQSGETLEHRGIFSYATTSRSTPRGESQSLRLHPDLKNPEASD